MLQSKVFRNLAQHRGAHQRIRQHPGDSSFVCPLRAMPTENGADLVPRQGDVVPAARQRQGETICVGVVGDDEGSIMLFGGGDTEI